MKCVLKIFNDNLSIDGWQLVEVMRISNKPVFAGRPIIGGALSPISGAKDVAVKLELKQYSLFQLCLKIYAEQSCAIYKGIFDNTLRLRVGR